MNITTVTQKGQVTIPIAIRHKLGLKRGDNVQFYVEADEVKVKPAPDFFSFRGVLRGRKQLSDKAIEKAAEKQAVKEYLERSARMKK